MFEDKINNLDLEFDDMFYNRCDNYIALLKQWGSVHNLTAELEQEKIENNIIDSIYPLKFLKKFDSFADIGTGAGYPGMLIAIARPDIKATLIEPRRKRVAFLNFVKNALRLENVEVICDRVKERTFDLITSRAVTNTSLLMNLTKNISNEQTKFLFYKGSLLEEEIQDAKLNDYDVISIKDRNYLYINKDKE